ncbi:MAG: hypothetical protein R3F43_29855 [bacterium]
MLVLALALAACDDGGAGGAGGTVDAGRTPDAARTDGGALDAGPADRGMPPADQGTPGRARGVDPGPHDAGPDAEGPADGALPDAARPADAAPPEDALVDAAPPPLPDLAFNELSCRDGEWIEIVLRGDAAASPAGWIVTDDPLDALRGQALPADEVPAGGFILLEELSFGVGCGERVYLLTPDRAIRGPGGAGLRAPRDDVGAAARRRRRLDRDGAHAGRPQPGGAAHRGGDQRGRLPWP